MDREHDDEPVTLEREPMRARGSLHAAGGRSARARRAALAACCIAAAWPLGVGAGVNEWTTTGPRGGMTFVAADPDSGGRVFAAAMGRLYGSVDSGRHWRAGNTPASGVYKVLQAMAFDPHVPGRVWAAFGGQEVSRSDNDGATWKATGIFGDWSPARPYAGTALRLAVSPHRAGNLHIANGSLWSSTDDGASWKRNTSSTLGGVIYDFALDPRTAGVLFAATGKQPVAKSTDDGVTWMPASAGLPAGSAGVRIALDPGAPDDVYAIVRVPQPDSCCPEAGHVVYVSRDGGASWASTGLSFPARIGFSDMQLAPVPLRPGTVFLRAGGSLYRTRDRGASWTPIELSRGDRVRSIAAGPNSTGIIASGFVFGMQRSLDLGDTWDIVNDGLPGSSVTSLAVASKTPFAMLASTTDVFGFSAEILRSGADGDAWAPSFLQEVSRLSTISGFSFVLIGGPYGFSAHAVNARTGTAFALADPPETLWRSGDGGETWARGGPVSLGRGSFDQMAIAPGDDAIVYAWGAGTQVLSSWNPGGLARSLDGGNTWSAIGTGQGVSTLAIAPGNPRIAYRSDVWSGGISRTHDAGASWVQLAGPDIDPTLYKFDVDPGNPNRLYASGEHLWRSDDGGATWKWIVGLSVLADRRFRLGAVDWSAPIPVVYAVGATGIVASTADPPDGPWSLVPGSGALGGVRALLVASAPGAPERTTLHAATPTGVYTFTPDRDGRYVPVYRFYNRYTDAHFYTADPAERAHVLSNYPRFVSEGIAFWALRAPEPGTVAVHRLYDGETGVHRYTGDPDERDRWLAAAPSLSYEGVAFHAFTSAEPGTVGAHRFTHAANGSIFVTAKWDEAFGVREDPLYAYDGATFRVIQAARAGR